MVVFLHPVDQVRDGKVAKVEPLRNSLWVASLLLVALLLGLGVLGYLFSPLVFRTPQTPTTTASPITATTTPSRTIETPTPAHPRSVTENSTRIPAGNEASREPKVVSMSRPTTWQFHPLVVSACLLLSYLTFAVLRYCHSRSKLVQGMTRWLIGKPPKEEKMLLHTFPYYLAITRSSCEVSCQSRDLNFEFPRHMFSTFQLVIKPLTTPMTL